jgi:AcrR family transcriptional regulator
MAERGLSGVAVEPLAARLGTTKGSFYWHFANRDALIGAALERWEEICTEQIITAVETEPDPGKRLRTLLHHAATSAADDPLEVSLLATADHPLVGAVLERVTERRIGYVARLFEEIGFPAEEAARRGLLAYSSYLGHTQLSHAVPQSLPTGEPRAAYLDCVIDLLTRR